MGAYQNNVQKGSGKSSKRGAVRNDDRLAAFSDGNVEGSADWSACDQKWIQAVIVGITSLGGAVTFGLSRDLGAHSLTLLLASKRKTLWFNGGADLDVELQGVVDTLEGMGP